MEGTFSLAPHVAWLLLLFIAPIPNIVGLRHGIRGVIKKEKGTMLTLGLIFNAIELFYIVCSVVMAVVWSEFTYKELFFASFFE